jgi:hypothetical protein
MGIHCRRLRVSYKATLALTFVCIILALSLFTSNVSAQEQPNYYLTVTPVLGDTPQYMGIGQSTLIPFEVQWTYGPDKGKFIENATVTLEVADSEGKLVTTIDVNSTTGVFYLNYTQKNPNVLVFNSSKLLTQEGLEYSPDLFDSSTNVYGLASGQVRVYWDTFHVSIVNYRTGNLENIDATVNVTRLLLPEEGLTQSENFHVSKIVRGANVTINGVLAQEVAPGIYAASSSTWLPTAYLNVKVSSGNWTTTTSGFSFAHIANQPFWIYGAVFASFFAAGILATRFFVYKKRQTRTEESNYRFFGIVTLAATCIISFYWTIVAIEGTLHTFNWASLAVFGIFSVTLGFTGTLLLMRRKHPAAVMSAAMVPMIMNTLAVNASLSMYQLANPWIWLFSSLFLSIISAVFISRTEMFQRQPSIAAN